MRVPSGNDGGTSDETWFYTYNNDVDHRYFAPRSGFVRAKMKYYGLVGVLGDGGKTRLTWLVNMDFGGTVPSSFMNAMIVNLMVYPITIVENTTVHLQKKHGNVAAATSSAALDESRGDGTEAEASLSTSALLERIAGLEAQRKKDASTIAGLQRQVKRDAATISEDILRISGLEEEVSTLRQRRARSGAGADDERCDE